MDRNNLSTSLRSSNHLIKNEFMDKSLDSSASDPSHSNNAAPELNIQEQEKRSNPAQRHVCGFCGAGFNSHHPMTDHINNLHKSNSPLRKHVCRFCGARFTQGFSMTRHIRARHGSNGWGSVQRDHICQFCGARYSLQSSVERHIRDRHETNGRDKCKMF